MGGEGMGREGEGRGGRERRKGRGREIRTLLRIGLVTGLNLGVEAIEDRQLKYAAFNAN